MLKLMLKRGILTPLLLLLFAATPFFLFRPHTVVRASQLAVTGSHHYFYDFPNGTMNVYDLDNNFVLVQSVSIPTTNVRGVVFDPQSSMLYFSDGGNGGQNGTGSLIKYNLVTQSLVYKQVYNLGSTVLRSHPMAKPSTCRMGLPLTMAPGTLSIPLAVRSRAVFLLPTGYRPMTRT